MNRIIRDNPGRTAEFAAALQGLHRELTANPEIAGESREPGYRVFISGPLTFWFRPALDEGRVYVIRVHFHGLELLG